ncbi:hypothetical protein ADUPG1_005156, partial [Aduncisulcus paluster]
AAFKDIIRMLKEAPTLAFVDDKATLELYTEYSISESSWGEFEAHSPSLEAERSSLPSSSHPLTTILDRAKVFFLRWMWVVQKEEKTSVKEGRKLCRVGE